MLDMIFHIGYVIPTTNSRFDPNTLYPWQTWERYAKGKTLVGVNESDTDFASVGKNGGVKTHALTVEQMPAHNHPGSKLRLTAAKVASGSTYSRVNEQGTGTSYLVDVASQGGGKAHPNLQPYVTVYYWRRTA